MLTKQCFAVILLTLSVSCAAYASVDNSFEDDANAGRQCDAKLSVALSDMKTETNLKLDAINKNIPEKLEKYLENKLSISEKNNRDIQEGIHEKLHKLEQNILNRLEEYVDEKIDSLEKHVYGKIEKTVAELKHNVPKRDDANDHKLREVKKNTSEHFEGNIDLKLNTTKKNTFDINVNILHKLDALEQKFEQHIDQNLKETLKIFSDLKQDMNKRMDTLQDIEKDVFREVSQTQYTLGCKEQLGTGRAYLIYHRMDNKSLNHVAFANNSAGLSYFEMHLAVKGTNPYIRLGSSPGIHVEFGIFKNTITYYKNLKVEQTVIIPNMISDSRYTAFSIKINNGALEIRREGSTTPLISDSDAAFAKLKNFSIAGNGIIRYDCPPNIFEFLYKEC